MVFADYVFTLAATAAILWGCHTMGLPYYGAGSQDLATAKVGSCCEADESRREASEASSEGRRLELDSRSSG